MVSYKDIVDKLKRRVSKDEYATGIQNYVNAPDFEDKYQEQINKAIENYKAAGAPETWATKQALKLKLVSPDEWKSAITNENVPDLYYNKLLTALDQKAKMFAIPAEQDNTIQDIINKLSITDKKQRMLVAFDVGQHFEKAVLYRLAGDSTNLDNEIQALITDLFNDNIIPPDASDNSKPDATTASEIEQIIKTNVENCATTLQG